MLCSVGTSSVRNLNLSDDTAQKERIIVDIRDFGKGSNSTKESLLFPSSLQKIHEEHKYTVLSDREDKKKYLGQKIPFPSAESNAAIRWILNRIEELPCGNASFSCDIHLFPGKELDPLFTAWITKAWIDAACRFGLFGFHGDTIHVEVHEPIFFEVQDPQCMYRGVSALFEKFDDVRKSAQETGEKVLINATGGFKVISGFSLLYAQIHSLPCIYIYETNDDVVELQALPLSFAVGALDEEIGFLKGLKTLINKDILTKDAHKKLPAWVCGLLLEKDDGRYETSYLATTLINHFNENRRKNSGVGRRLLDMLIEEEEKKSQSSSSGDALRSYLENRIQKEWAELWMGDQIPETVEHSRRHSKRLMEIGGHLLESARNVLEPAGLLEPLPLALLISCIYLHDIGHTALGFPVDESCSESAFPLGMFPTTVREVHHLLSRDMIQSRMEELFPHEENGLEGCYVEALRELVPEITAYHRGYTKLAEPERKDLDKFEPNEAVRATGELLYGVTAFEETLQPLERILEKKIKQLEEWGLDVEILLGVAGLLRFIDGCDVQADRVVDEAYLKARLERTKYEARMLHLQILPFEEFLKNLLCPGGGEKKNLWELLNEMKSCEDISSEQALGKKEDIPEDLRSKVKKAKNLIYPTILKELRQMCSRERDFAALLSNPHFLPLSLANKITFKWEQFLHFQKHSSVNFVLPSKKGERSLVLLRGKENADLESVKKDIQEELEKVHLCKVLEQLDIQIDIPSKKEEEHDGI